MINSRSRSMIFGKACASLIASVLIFGCSPELAKRFEYGVATPTTYIKVALESPIQLEEFNNSAALLADQRGFSEKVSDRDNVQDPTNRQIWPDHFQPGKPYVRSRRTWTRSNDQELQTSRFAKFSVSSENQNNEVLFLEVRLTMSTGSGTRGDTFGDAEWEEAQWIYSELPKHFPIKSRHFVTHPIVFTAEDDAAALIEKYPLIGNLINSD